jgi:hypothetical protein
MQDGFTLNSTPISSKTIFQYACGEIGMRLASFGTVASDKTIKKSGAF